MECQLSSEPPDLITRPPIGFIVEGHDEHTSYPSLVNRIIGASGFYFPITNAGGNGSILRSLGTHLKKLVLSYNPYHVIVTLDLKDAIDSNLFNNCGEIIIELKKQVHSWMSTARDDRRLMPLPESITIVIQIQTFETWLLADTERICELCGLSEDEWQFSNIDEEIRNPMVWLCAHVPQARRLKSPKQIKQFISKIRPDVMKDNSNSFNKFYREVHRSYDNWRAVCGL